MSTFTGAEAISRTKQLFTIGARFQPSAADSRSATLLQGDTTASGFMAFLGTHYYILPPTLSQTTKSKALIPPSSIATDKTSPTRLDRERKVWALRSSSLHAHRDNPAMPTKTPLSGISSGSNSSSPQSGSTGIDNRHSDASASSVDPIGTCRARSPGGSWITYSEKSVLGRRATAAAFTSNNIGLDVNQIRSKSSAKSKIFDMLSAVDRKRKQKLPPGKSAHLNITQATSSETLAQAPAFSTALNFKNMQPRGATEREDHSALRAFFNSNPARPEDKAETHVPRSAFDWDDSSGPESSPTTKKSNLRSLQRATRRWQAANGLGSKTKAGEAMFGTGLSVDAWMQSAQKYAEGRRTEAGVLTETVVNQRASDDSLNSSTAGCGPLAVKRESVLKLFESPVWSNQDDITRAITSEFQGAKTRGGRDQDATMKTSVEPTYQKCGSGIATPATSSEHDGSRSPTKSESKMGRFFGPELSPNSFLYFDWSRAGSGISAINAPEYAQITWDILDSTPSIERPETRLTHKSSKTSLLKKLKSQLFVTTEPSTSAESDLERPASIKSPRGPRPSTPIVRGISARDVGSKSDANPFLDDTSRTVPSQTQVNGKRLSFANRARQFNAALDNSPTRHEKQSIHVPTVGVHPRVTALPKDPNSPSPTPSSTYSITTNSPPLPRGYPSGPEDPNWEDAVKRVKIIVESRERRAAEEARQEEKELKLQEKKVKKLQAGRDLVMRGSQLGLTLKKPVDEVTEDEFEAVGGLATTPGKETSAAKKSAIFSALFTKILGTPQEKEDHAKQIKLKLERHKSLELLTTATGGDIEEPTSEDRTQYEKALRSLNGDVSPLTTTPRSGRHETTAGNRHASSTGDEVGLGIIAETTASNSKPITSMSFQEFIALKRQRQNFVAQEENVEADQDGVALSDIAEEDTDSYARPELEGQHESNDGSSWCTESEYSIDEIESTMTSVISKGPAQSNDRDFGTELDRCLDFGRCAASQDSEGHQSLILQKDSQDDDAASSYSDEIEHDAMPAPLNIRVLKVKQSSTHVQPAHSNSFIPDRQASFHARIQEVSRLQEAHIGSRSHPALRPTSGEHHEGQTGDPFESVKCDEIGKPMRDSLDSGTGTMSEDQLEQVDEGYVTGPVQQTEFIDENCPKTRSSKSTGSTSITKFTGVPVACENGERPSDIDLSALRTELGLSPLRLASSSSTRKHPHHPFDWNHEKVMCREVHNPMEFLPEMPSIPRSEPVSVSRMDSEFFNTSSAKKSMGEPKMCENCGSLCCRFANLMVMSKIKTSGDVLEEMVRAKAQQRIDMLRTCHPTGIEEYSTFVHCAHCRRSVCTRCAERCNEILCQSIVCMDCLAASEACPVHQ